MSLKVFKASAGSGKTYRLALEYIAFALSSPSPTAFAGILAVTFTNKATAEMKQRILSKLYNIANNLPDGTFLDDLHRLLPGLSARELRERAQATLSAIVHDYDRFRVETIDSFFQSLLTNLAYEVGLPRGFKVDLDDKEIISRAVDRMLLSIGSSGHVSARVVKIVIDYMEEHISDSKGWSVAKDLKVFATKNLTCDSYLKHETEIERILADPEQVRQFKNTLHEIINRGTNALKEDCEIIERLLAEPFFESLNKTTGKTYTKFVSSLKEGNLEVSLSDSAREGIRSRGDSLVKKADKKNASLCEYATRLTDALDELNRKYEEVACAVFTAQITLGNFVPFCLLSEIGKEVTRICNEHGTILLSKTPNLFHRMVGNEDASFVFERAGTTFRHVMIDEFQDTSNMQWHIFSRLLIENISQGNDCMLVGDIKQSIYRWRGGDWHILQSLGTEETTETLSSNYRSLYEVVDFNNRFFPFAATVFDEKDTSTAEAGIISDIYRDGQQTPINTKPGEGYVRLITASKDTNKEELLEDLYGQILTLHQAQHVPFNKMVILIRQHSDAIPLIDYFSAFHPDVPLSSNEAFKLGASPSVNMLVAALKYMTDETDTVSLTLALQTGDRLFARYGFRRRWSAENLLVLREEIDVLPLYELVHRLLGVLQIDEAEEAGAGQSAFLYAFFDKLSDYINDNDTRLDRFLTYWDDALSNKAIPAEGQDAIMIMTIHKAKGLEQFSVFIPYCNWRIIKSNKEDILWCETKGLPSPYSDMPILPVKKEKNTPLSDFKEYFHRDNLYLRIDSINELYVAFTRARANLYIWSNESSTRKDTVFELFNEIFEREDTPFSIIDNEYGGKTFESGTPVAYQIKKEEGKDKRENPFEPNNVRTLSTAMRPSDTRIVFKQSNRAKDFIAELDTNEGDSPNEKKQEGYIDRGKLLHYIFSLIERTDLVDRAFRTVRLEGLIENDKEEALLRRLVEKRLADPRVAGWFSGEGRVLSEATIRSRRSDGTIVEHRPDRVVVLLDETLVIDYKFGTPRPAYNDQVKEYINLLSRMGYKSVKGYLWYVYSGEIEGVESSNANA